MTKTQLLLLSHLIGCDDGAKFTGPITEREKRNRCNPRQPLTPLWKLLECKIKKLPDRQKISLMHMFRERVYNLCWAVNAELLNVRDWKRRTVWMYSSLEIKLMDNIRQFTAVTRHFRWLKKFKVRRSKLYHAISNRATPKDRMVKGR